MAFEEKNKAFQPSAIPKRRAPESKPLPPPEKEAQISLSEELFFTMEYDAGKIPAASITKPQKISPPIKDPLRERFYQMRAIARRQNAPFAGHSRFFSPQVQQDNAKIFYHQAVFMADFTDNYTETVPFSSYFPTYQLLGHEQLRTYFSWRTRVRKGDVSQTSLSYVFLYLYELLNNIGVSSPKEGLSALLSFWQAFRFGENHPLDPYMVRWLKDYHIYYDLPWSLREFALQSGLFAQYPTLSDPADRFGLFCSLAKYDIRQSAFYTDETAKMIADCFVFVLEKVQNAFQNAGIDFDAAFFRPTKKLAFWHPFRDALFHPQLTQPDRRVILSESEIYICRNNTWRFSPSLTTEKGRQFMGFVLKRMEVCLRKALRHKFKITAALSMVHPETLAKLQKSGIAIDQVIDNAAAEFYRETTKTVVAVDRLSLARIRQEALATQEALLVEPETEETLECAAGHGFFAESVAESAEAEDTNNAVSPWETLREALSPVERQALALWLHGENVKPLADENGLMLEVLADGINEKAADCIGDFLLDEDMLLFSDYENQVKEMVETA